MITYENFGVERRGKVAGMKRSKFATQDLPEIIQLKRELQRLRRRKAWWGAFGNLLFSLAVAAAVAVLVAILALPILRIYGNSMTPTLCEGDYVVSVKGTEFHTGDLVVFYLGNNVLVKRYIAGPGQWVDIDGNGNVYVDGKLLEEPYLTEKALGDCDITLPYQVPDNRIFCMGDHRETSVDSRSTTIGCIQKDRIIGRLVFRIWPVADFGPLE